jgi:hypothetical protein
MAIGTTSTQHHMAMEYSTFSRYFVGRLLEILPFRAKE